MMMMMMPTTMAAFAAPQLDKFHSNTCDSKFVFFCQFAAAADGASVDDVDGVPGRRGEQKVRAPQFE